MLGIHSDCTDEDGVVDKKRADVEDYNGAERVVDSGPGVPEGTLEHAVLDVLDENSGIRNYPVDSGVIGFLPEAREGIVEHGILELPSGTPNCVAEQGVTDPGPRPLDRGVGQGVAGVLRATSTLTVGHDVLWTCLGNLERSHDQGVTDLEPRRLDRGVVQ